LLALSFAINLSLWNGAEIDEAARASIYLILAMTPDRFFA
jgi:hypothetical protein